MKRKKVTGRKEGKGDMPKEPKPAGSVDPGRLFHGHGNGLQGRQIEGDIVS